ncbi:MAG: hypothetical protein RR576_07215 [Oscillospiraceae bacterium]
MGQINRKSSSLPKRRLNKKRSSSQRQQLHKKSNSAKRVQLKEKSSPPQVVQIKEKSSPLQVVQIKEKSNSAQMVQLKEKSSPSQRHRIGVVSCFAIAIAAVVALLLAVLWFYLADYQKNLPENLANKVLAEYQSYDAKTIANYSTNLPAYLLENGKFSDYYKANADFTKMYFYQTKTSEPHKLSYEFVAENKRIATVMLEESGEPSLFRFPQYKVASVAGYPLTSYKFAAPSDVDIFANDTAISEKYCVKEEIITDNFSDMENTVFKMKTYEISDFISPNELRVVRKDKCPCAVIWSEDKRSAVIKKEISAELQGQITKFANDFSKTYSPFATKKSGNINAVLGMLYPHTSFYKAVRIYTNPWGETYVKDRYENYVVDAFKQYSQTEFSCNVSFDYVIQVPDGVEKAYPFNMTYYITNRGGHMQLVDMQAKAAKPKTQANKAIVNK